MFAVRVADSGDVKTILFFDNAATFRRVVCVSGPHE
jgi:hypothetical protein